MDQNEYRLAWQRINSLMQKDENELLRDQIRELKTLYENVCFHEMRIREGCSVFQALAITYCIDDNHCMQRWIEGHIYGHWRIVRRMPSFEAEHVRDACNKRPAAIPRLLTLLDCEMQSSALDLSAEVEARRLIIDILDGPDVDL